MKRWFTLLTIVLCVGAGSYGLTRWLGPAPKADEDHLSWMAREFDLTAEQKTCVEKLQRDYIPVCSDHCALIVDARERLAARPEDTALRQEVAALERRCQQATLAHVRQVAACMTPAQGRRFLALVEPRILHHDHQAAFDLK